MEHQTIDHHYIDYRGVISNKRTTKQDLKIKSDPAVQADFYARGKRHGQQPKYLIENYSKRVSVQRLVRFHIRSHYR